MAYGDPAGVSIWDLQNVNHHYKGVKPVGSMGQVTLRNAQDTYKHMKTEMS